MMITVPVHIHTHTGQLFLLYTINSPKCLPLDLTVLSTQHLFFAWACMAASATVLLISMM